MKHVLYSILVLALFSCSKDEPEKPNTSPSPFEVTAKVEGTELTLTWTEAVDADGDAVTYAVVYGDTLAKGLTARTYTLKDLPYETEISGTVVASDGRGGKVESGFTVKTGAEPWDDRFVKISDIEFEKYLIKKGIDDVLDGKILKWKAEEVTSMWISEEIDISNLNGLNEFINLQELYVGYTSIKSLQISNLNKLKELSIWYNYNLEEFDISHNTELEVLNTGFNNLKKIDIDSNKKLKRLICNGHKNLTEIDLTNNVLLNEVRLMRNNLTHLNLSTLKSLETLWVSENNLEELNLCNNRYLNNLMCDKNKISTILLHPNTPIFSNWKKDDTASYKVCD